MGHKHSKHKGKDAQKSASIVVSEIKANPQLGETLSHLPLLFNTPTHHRNLLAGALEKKKFGKHATIFAQGDEAKGFYLIKDGSVEVIYTNSEGKRNVIATLGEKDYFGETALTSHRTRGASVVTKTKTQCWFLRKTRFDALIASGRIDIQFASRRRAVTAERRAGVQNQTKILEEIEPPSDAVTSKTAAQRELVLAALSGSALFIGLDTKQKNDVCDEFYRLAVPSGTDVIKQGQPGINFYCVESGHFDVLKTEEKKTSKVADQGPGTFFGDLALVHHTQRAATVTSTEDSVLWVLNRYTYRRLIQHIGETRIRQYTQFMNEVELLSALASYERHMLADALEEVRLAQGVKVFSKGDEGDAMYFVVHGTCLAYMYDEKTGEPIELATMSRGEFFGERALLSNEGRAASVICQVDCFLLKLDRAAFERVLGPLEPLLLRRVESYNEAAVVEEDEAEDLDRTIQFDDLEHIANLGKGAFGTVTLVQHRETKVTYALKAVSKAQIVDTQQEEHIINEKTVMATVHHPFFVNLITTFNNKNQIFFLLEPSLGGELFTTLRRHRHFPENTARFYAAHVILGFECLHAHNYIYRDLKPENLLMCPDGYIKITDFGFAKKCRSRCYTLCGTPEYLAPEILAVPPTGHGKGVDWWCVGVLIFEMLSSYSPFYHQNFQTMYAKIKKGRFRFPSHVKTNARDIISALLTVNVSKRLGVLRRGATDIKEHPWFNGFSWEALLAKELVAPIIPDITDEFDTQNFHDFTPKPVPVYDSSLCSDPNWDANF